MRFRGRLQRMKGIFAPEVPPDDADTFGKAPDGRTIYRRTKKIKAKVPVAEDGTLMHPDQVVKDHETSEGPVFRPKHGSEIPKQRTRGGNPMTGELGIPVYRWVEDREVPEHFVITRGKHGNNRITVVDPDALDAEVEAKKSAKRKDRFLERVAAHVETLPEDQQEEAIRRMLGLDAVDQKAPEFDDDGMDLSVDEATAEVVAEVAEMEAAEAEQAAEDAEVWNSETEAF